MDTRMVNSAIYTEPPTDYQNLEYGKRFEPTDTIASVDDSLETIVSHLNLNAVSNTNFNAKDQDEEKRSNTYRCVSTTINDSSFLDIRCCKITSIASCENMSKNKNISRKLPLKNRNKSKQDTEPQNTESDPKVVKKSVSLPLIRQISYEEWKLNKEKELRKKRAKSEPLDQQKKSETLTWKQQEKEQQEKENFLRWLKQKEMESYVKKKRALENELKLQRTLSELDEVSDSMKKIALMQWGIKKKIEKKVENEKVKTEQEIKKHIKQKKLDQSLEAFKKWAEKSKNVPKPTTQGLLPHQLAKPTFINPKPWQSVAENIGANSDS